MKQKLRWIAILCAAELSIAGLSVAFGDAGFNSGRAFAAAFWGLQWAYFAAFLIVQDHEARGRGQ